VNAFNMLDAFIGLAFVFLTLSLVVTSLGETLSQALHLRGNILAIAVERLVSDQFVKSFYAHPLVQALQKDDGRKPSYIPDRVFADAFADLLLSGQLANLRTNPAAFDREINAAWPKIADPSLAVTLQGFWRGSDYDIDAFLQRLMTWFNDTAERSTGWFKRRLNRWLLALGFAVAIVFNVNAIDVYRTLSSNDALRTEYVQKAVDVTTQQLSDTKAVCSKYQIQPADCDALSLAKAVAPDIVPLVGWSTKSPVVANVWVPITSGTDRKWAAIFASALGVLLGWIMTAVALSLGAPFWFDILQRLVNLRGSLRATASVITAPAADAQVVSVSSTSSTQTTAVVATSASAPAANLETFSSFRPTTLGFDAMNAFWLSRFSSLAYGAAPEVRAQLEAWGIDGELVEAGTDTQFVIARSPSALVLAFRGTDVSKAADILTDLDFELTASSWPGGKPYNVHHGFEAEFALAWPKVEATLKTYGAFGGTAPLFITGHSLGGALAMLAAAHILDRNLVKPTEAAYVAALYTYGQPRVGDPTFADRVAQLLPGRYFRAVNNRDAVPLVPPPIAGAKNLRYAHSGSIVYFNEFGRMLLDPPLWYRGLDKVTVDMGQQALEDKLVEVVRDHAVTVYVTLCRAMLLQPVVQ
jgi:hypothetical protein